jgi:hypothetical protein
MFNEICQRKEDFNKKFRMFLLFQNIKYIINKEVLMNKFNYLFIGLFVFAFASSLFAQDDEFVRPLVNVPKVDPGAITLDGQANEAVWQNAARADLITPSGYNGWFNHYYFGDDLTEPDYDELYARMLWSEDTLYVYIHVDEIVTDTSDLYFEGGKFNSDQIFIGLSNRLGVDMQGWYDGNPYAAPNGPYHFWIIGDEVSLNGGDPSWIPDDYRCPDDTSRIFFASDYARWAVVTNAAAGTWTVEMAIYHPNITAGSSIGFNIGGSNAQSFEGFGEDEDHTYTYYTWYPHVPNDPYANPTGEHDPGYYSLVTTAYWPILKFTPGGDEDIVRAEVNVPRVDPGAITLDGQANEAVWQNAAQSNLITQPGYNGWFNYYYDFGDALTEPDYEELYARMLMVRGYTVCIYPCRRNITDTTDCISTGGKVQQRSALCWIIKQAWKKPAGLV